MGNRALISHRCLKQSFKPQGEELRASWTKDVDAGSQRPQKDGQVDDVLDCRLQREGHTAFIRRREPMSNSLQEKIIMPIFSQTD